MHVTLPRQPARRTARLDWAAAGARRVGHLAGQPKLGRAARGGAARLALADHLGPAGVGTPGAGPLQVPLPDAPPAGANPRGHPRG